MSMSGLCSTFSFVSFHRRSRVDLRFQARHPSLGQQNLSNVCSLTLSRPPGLLLTAWLMQAISRAYRFSTPKNLTAPSPLHAGTTVDPGAEALRRSLASAAALRIQPRLVLRGLPPYQCTCNTNVFRDWPSGFVPFARPPYREGAESAVAHAQSANGRAVVRAQAALSPL